jgi:hypothetical protein
MQTKVEREDGTTMGKQTKKNIEKDAMKSKGRMSPPPAKAPAGASKELPESMLAATAGGVKSFKSMVVKPLGNLIGVRPTGQQRYSSLVAPVRQFVNSHLGQPTRAVAPSPPVIAPKPTKSGQITAPELTKRAARIRPGIAGIGAGPIKAGTAPYAKHMQPPAGSSLQAHEATAMRPRPIADPAADPKPPELPVWERFRTT